MPISYGSPKNPVPDFPWFHMTKVKWAGGILVLQATGAGFLAQWGTVVSPGVIKTVIPEGEFRYPSFVSGVPFYYPTGGEAVPPLLVYAPPTTPPTVPPPPPTVDLGIFLAEPASSGPWVWFLNQDSAQAAPPAPPVTVPPTLPLPPYVFSISVPAASIPPPAGEFSLQLWSGGSFSVGSGGTTNTGGKLLLQETAGIGDFLTGVDQDSNAVLYKAFDFGGFK